MNPGGEIISKRGISWLEMLVSALIVILIACIIILSLVPPISRDALVQHLAVPKLYLKHGGMYEIPFMSFSYYPMNLDLLYLIPLYFGNDIVPKFIHFTFAILTAWLIFLYLKKRTHRIYALFGILLFLSIPIIVKLSITAYIDLGIMFFSFASLLSLLRWMENGFRPRFLIISGVLCGLGLGTKYNGLVTLFLLTLFVPFLYSRFHPGDKHSFFKAAEHAVLFFFVSIVVFSPWMIRDYHWRKNPIYPLYEHWINPPEKPGSELGEDLGESSGLGLGAFVIRKLIYQEKGWEIALVPVRVFFAGRDGSPKQFDGELNPFLLVFSLLAFWRIKQDREVVKSEKKIMLAFSALFFTIAFFTSDLRIRYIAPIIPPLVILSVLGLANGASFVQSMKGGTAKVVGLAAIGSAMACALILNGEYVLRQFKFVEPFSYLSGKLSRDDYIARYRPEYPAMKFIDQNLPPSALVSFLFLGNRGYYCDRNYVYGEHTFGTIVREAPSAEFILGALERSGVSHLLLYYPLFERWVGDNFHENKAKIIRDFLEKYTRVSYTYNNFYLLSLEKPSS
jgi:uncharacterized membrane protein